MWKHISGNMPQGTEVVFVGTLGVLCILSFSAFLSQTVFSASPSPSAWFCHTEPYEQVSSTATKSKFASPIDFFTNIGTSMAQILCSGEGRAYINIGNENPDLLIYKFAYERDYDAKKWRKIELSGDKSTGPWLLGFASTELKYTPKNTKDMGQVLIYTCQQVQGVWKCGCTDRSCLSANWQLQTYSLLAQPSADEEGEDSADNETDEPPRPYDEYMDDDYLSIYGLRATFLLPGQTIMGEGGGLTGRVTAHFGESVSVPVRLLDESRFNLTVPYIEPGVYKVWFTKGDMRSRNFMLTIKNRNSVGLVISSIEPSTLHAGDTVTIRGSGFTPKNNVVSIGSFRFSGIESKDGKTMTFSLVPDGWTENDIPQEAYAYAPRSYFDALLELEEMPTVRREARLPATVINSNGKSNALQIVYK